MRVLVSDRVTAPCFLFRKQTGPQEMRACLLSRMRKNRIPGVGDFPKVPGIAPSMEPSLSKLYAASLAFKVWATFVNKRTDALLGFSQERVFGHDALGVIVGLSLWIVYLPVESALSEPNDLATGVTNL